MVILIVSSYKCKRKTSICRISERRIKQMFAWVPTCVVVAKRQPYSTQYWVDIVSFLLALVLPRDARDIRLALFEWNTIWITISKNHWRWIFSQVQRYCNIGWLSSWRMIYNCVADWVLFPLRRYFISHQRLTRSG